MSSKIKREITEILRLYVPGLCLDACRDHCLPIVKCHGLGRGKETIIESKSRGVTGWTTKWLVLGVKQIRKHVAQFIGSAREGGRPPRDGLRRDKRYW